LDISIIIAHRGPGMGLWATVHACIADLEDTDLSYNFCIVSNGEQVLDQEARQVLWFLDKAGKLKYSLHHIEPLAPPTARQLATEQADGEFLFFFDNHCLVKHGYFKRAISKMKEGGLDMLHSTTRFYLGDKDNYHYKLTLKKNFWASAEQNKPETTEPYRIAAGGHGGFVVRRSVWEEVGGYGPIGLYEGYAGEELYFDLKMWRLGKQNWLDPQLLHYHYAGNRNYPRHYTDDYFRNMLMTAHIIGGKTWMYDVQESFTNHYPRQMKSEATIFDLMEQAEKRSQSHADWLNKHSVKSLDELLAWFPTQNILG
jgi:hypothetical protein